MILQRNATSDPIRTFATLLAAASLAACSGGASTRSLQPATPGATNGPTKSTPATRLRIFIPTSNTQTAKRGRHFVSTSTNGIVVSVYASPEASNPTPLATVGVDLSATSAACTASATGRSCSVPIPAPVGTDDFVFTTYDAVPSASGTPAGNALGTATVTTTIAANTTNAVNVALGGIIASVVLEPVPSVYAAVAGSETLGVTGLDADKNIVLAGMTTVTNGNVTQTDTYADPITISTADSTSGSTHTTLSLNGGSPAASVTSTKSTDVITLAYDGAATAPYYATISATLQGASSSAAVGRFAPLFVAASGAGTFTNGATPMLAFSNAYAAETLTASESSLATPTFTFSVPNQQRANSVPCATGALYESTTATTYALTSGRFSTTGTGCTVQISDGYTTVSVPTTVNATASLLYAAIGSNAVVYNVTYVAGAVILRQNRSIAVGAAATGIAHDAGGTLYLPQNNAIYTVPSGGTTASLNGAIVPFPGNLLVDDGQQRLVITINFSGQYSQNSEFASFSLPIKLGAPPSNPQLAYGAIGNAVAVAEDAAGNTYYGTQMKASANETQVTRYGPIATATGQQTPTYLASSPTITTTAQGIACDAAGDVYIVDGTNLYEYTVSGNTLTRTSTNYTFGGPDFSPTSIAIDGAGDIFVGGSSLGLLTIETAAPGQTTFLPTTSIGSSALTQLSI